MGDFRAELAALHPRVRLSLKTAFLLEHLDELLAKKHEGVEWEQLQALLASHGIEYKTANALRIQLEKLKKKRGAHSKTSSVAILRTKQPASLRRTTVAHQGAVDETKSPAEPANPVEMDKTPAPRGSTRGRFHFNDE